MATYWNIKGERDGYRSKFWRVPVVPIVLVGVSLLSVAIYTTVGCRGISKQDDILSDKEEISMREVQNPHEILSLIRNHYEKLHSFSCNWTRTYRGVEETNTGLVKFKQPNKAKFYGVPLTVCDGKNEFFYDELEKTVWIAPVSEKEDLAIRFARTNIAALIILFAEGFEIATVLEDDKKYRLKFKNKSSGEIEGKIEVDKTSLRLISFESRSVEITPEEIFEMLKKEGALGENQEENQKIFELLQSELQREPLVVKIEEKYSDWQENIQIEDSEFEFTIPEGVEIKKVERIGCDILCKDLLLKKLK